jgi:lipoprotein NlpI
MIQIPTRLLLLLTAVLALPAATALAQRTPPPSPPAGTTPSNPEQDRLKREAEDAYQASDFPRCIDLTGRVLAQNPRDHVALYLRASARVELGSAKRDLKEVRAGIEDAREAMRHGGTDQINYYLPYFYGMTALAQLENRKEHANVVIQFAGSLLSRPTLKPEEKANILYQRATAYVFDQNFEAAARDFESAAALAPTHLGARLGLADTYLQMKRPDKAEAAYTAAVQSAPNNPLVYNNRGMFFQQQGKLQNAIADFTRAVEIEPKFTVAYTNRGFAALAEGNPLAAEADFTASLKVDPSQPLVYSLRGTSRLSQGNPQGAIEDYGQVLRIDSRNPIAHADLGFAKYFAGDYAGAIAAFDQAVTLDANLRYLNPWRYWAMAKSGQAQSATTKFASALNVAADKRDWVDALLSFIAGRISDQDLLKAVEQKDEPLRQAQLCEAYYFMAEKQAQANDAAAANQLYQQTLDTRQAHLSAYRGAQFALKSFPKGSK